ncbi:P27 family phage terminase small subunit [Tardiphaga alba]|uniref:P27 family phage terminase small subunit n=1 Tax=Tardiphaga alba TaxID=340268 RepID=A0ABX8A8H3_9BRAD|nr:P27 family phage terminase small subunit [Tardiphaga alba]QUS39547.1 P27 family phage terminase small subunit [Tardiphaga alba]
MNNLAITPISGGDGVPPEPDWRTIFGDDDDLAIAQEQWGIIIRDMREAGTLSVANGHYAKRLVEFRVQYERSSRHVAEKGAILAPTSKKAKVGQWNPHWSVMRQADENIRVAEAELGLSPVRRGKATKVQHGKKTSRAADAFLRPVSK